MATRYNCREAASNGNALLFHEYNVPISAFKYADDTNLLMPARIPTYSDMMNLTPSSSGLITTRWLLIYLKLR